MNVSLPGMLTVAFIVLRLTGHIAWSWLWVLSPIWISIGLGILILALMAFVAIIATLRAMR